VAIVGEPENGTLAYIGLTGRVRKNPSAWGTVLKLRKDGGFPTRTSSRLINSAGPVTRPIEPSTMNIDRFSSLDSPSALNDFRQRSTAEYSSLSLRNYNPRLRGEHTEDLEASKREKLGDTARKFLSKANKREERKIGMRRDWRHRAFRWRRSMI